MTFTEQDIQALLPQYPSHAAYAGIAPRDWAIARLRHMPAPPPPAPSELPAPARELPMPYSDGQLRVFDAQMARGPADQADDARDWAELNQIDTEIDRLIAPLRQRRAVVAERINRRRAN